MDEFLKPLGEWATKQSVGIVIILVVIVVFGTYGHEWLKVILEHFRENKRINLEESRRQEQTAREIREKINRRNRRRRAERDRRDR